MILNFSVSEMIGSNFMFEKRIHGRKRFLSCLCVMSARTNSRPISSTSTCMQTERTLRYGCMPELSWFVVHTTSLLLAMFSFKTQKFSPSSLGGSQENPKFLQVFVSTFLRFEILKLLICCAVCGRILYFELRNSQKQQKEKKKHHKLKAQCWLTTLRDFNLIDRF